MDSGFTFSRKKYLGLLGTSTFAMAIECVVLLTDTIVVGSFVGEAGISGVNLVTPLFSIIAFLAIMIALGTVYRYTAAVGAFDKKRAGQSCGLGLILAIITGVVFFLLVLLGENAYFDFMGATGDTLKWAKDYYSYFRITALIFPLNSVLSELVYSDGDEFTCNMGYVAQIGGNIVLSIFLCMKMGTAGCSLGTLIGTALATLILCTHFLKKKNSIHFIPYFNFKEIWAIIQYSIVDSGLYLFWGILTIIIEKRVITKYGEMYLPIVSVLVAAIELTMIFDGCASAAIPLVNQYKGEDNSKGIRLLMKLATKVSLIEGIIFVAALEICAGLLPRLFSIQDPTLVRFSTDMIRIYAPTAFITALLFLYTSYYVLRDKVAPAFFVVALKDLGFPAVLSIVFTSVMDIHGVSVALLLSPVLALVVGTLLSIALYGKEKFPLLLDKKDGDIFIYTIDVTKEQILMIRDQAEADLRHLGISEKTIMRIMILIEDGYQMIEKQNKGKDNVISELSIIVKDRVEVVFKDTGVPFDMTGEDTDENSIRKYLVDSIVQNTSISKYLMSSSFNRYTFSFEK